MIRAGSRENANQHPEDRKLLKSVENRDREGMHVIKDKAHEGNKTQQLVLEMLPVVPPESNRLNEAGV
jgi:hypothetical protein